MTKTLGALRMKQYAFNRSSVTSNGRKVRIVVLPSLPK